MQRRYFSQRGEDYILWSIFDPSYVGVFLDVGALEGQRFSNTLSFEEQGWTGVCVEAHPYYIPMLQKNRPKSIVVHAAVTNVDQDEITFYANMFGSFSCLDPSLEDLFKRCGKAFDGYRKVIVKARTVSTILTENNIGHVDVVSVDVEGTELDVMKGFDLAKYEPRILVLEAVTKSKEQPLIEYMLAQGYTYANILGNNLFFCKAEEDVTIVRNIGKIPINLTTIKHPLAHLLK